MTQERNKPPFPERRPAETALLLLLLIGGLGLLLVQAEAGATLQRLALAAVDLLLLALFIYDLWLYCRQRIRWGSFALVSLLLTLGSFVFATTACADDPVVKRAYTPDTDEEVRL